MNLQKLMKQNIKLNQSNIKALKSLKKLRPFSIFIIIWGFIFWASFVFLLLLPSLAPILFTNANLKVGFYVFVYIFNYSNTFLAFIILVPILGIFYYIFNLIIFVFSTRYKVKKLWIWCLLFLLISPIFGIVYLFILNKEIVKHKELLK